MCCVTASQLVVDISAANRHPQAVVQNLLGAALLALPGELLHVPPEPPPPSPPPTPRPPPLPTSEFIAHAMMMNALVAPGAPEGAAVPCSS
jgi:hypothetical protein